MLAIFRRSLATWPVRLFFGVLVLSFGLWGVADVIRNIGRESSAATVAGERIDMPELQEAYRRNLSQATRALGTSDPSPEIRRAVAMQTMGQLITQKALAANAHDLGVVVPEAALATAMQEVPQFRNAQGNYDPDLARQVLRNNGLNERTFADMIRASLVDRQVLGAVTAGAAAPADMVKQQFEFDQEKRVADAVAVPFSEAQAAGAPTQAQLERWWANHPERYSTPEYRRVKAIILAPETLAKEITVSDDDLKSAWDQHKAEFNKPERRSAQVILAQDEPEAQRLVALWNGGADWSEMQKEAAKTGAAPVELTDAARNEFPAPELGDAVFAAQPGLVPPPVHSALGWHVVKVSKVTDGGAKTFDEARDALRQRVVIEKAADLMYDRANRIENLLSSGGTLDTLPGDLGVAAVTGSLDAQGNTPAGHPAPIPGSPELRTAFVQAAFAAKPDEPAKLVQAPNAADGSQSFYALTVEKVIPPTPKPLDEVIDKVRSDWIAEQQRRAQEETAAKIYGSLRRGFTLAAAAEKVGLQVRRLPPTGRAAPAEGFPPALLDPLFGLKKGEAAMVETKEGYIVAVLSDIQFPDPKSDPIGFSQVKQAEAQALAQDIQAVYANAVRERANPRVNEAAVASLHRDIRRMSAALAHAAAPGYAEFRAAYEQGRGHLIWARGIADLETPVAAYLKLAEGRPYAFLLESVEGGASRGRYSIIGLAPDLIWRCRDGQPEINRNALSAPFAFVADARAPLDSLRALTEETRLDIPEGLPPMAGGLVGYLGYDMVRQMERLPAKNVATLDLPDSVMVRPTLFAIFDNVTDLLTLAAPVFPRPDVNAAQAWAAAQGTIAAAEAALSRPIPLAAPPVALPALPEPASNFTKAGFMAAVERAKEYIFAGDVFQVVPSQRFSVPFALPPFALYRALRRISPAPFLFYLDFAGFSVVGSSPEILVRLRDNTVTIRPLAGTRRRGATHEEDERLAAELLADPKERAEHLMLLDLGRNDVGRVAELGTVRVTESFAIERFSHVMHIMSDVQGQLRAGLDAIDALVAGFPAGTLTGAPKVRAMEIIEELEPTRRGIYAGCIGYFSANGTMDTCIGLRTAVVKDGTMYVQAGCGVVADSDPEAEYEETRQKARALFRAAEEAVNFAAKRTGS